MRGQAQTLRDALIILGGTGETAPEVADVAMPPEKPSAAAQEPKKLIGRPTGKKAAAAPAAKTGKRTYTIPPGGRWTAAEDELILAGLRRNKTAAEISESFPTRTLRAVELRIGKLNKLRKGGDSAEPAKPKPAPMRAMKNSHVSRDDEEDDDSTRPRGGMLVLDTLPPATMRTNRLGAAR